MEFPFFNQGNAKQILKEKINEFQNIMQMVTFANKQIPSIKIVKFEIPNYQKQDEQYKMKLQKMLFEDKKKYHQIIKHTSNLGRQKQGMIINILDNGNNEYITNYKQINSQCIEQISIISGRIQQQLVRSWNYQNEITLVNVSEPEFKNIEIPNLQVTDEQEKKRQNKVNGFFNYKWLLRGDKYEYYNKAISYDWTHLSIIREMWEQSQRQDFSFMNLNNLRNQKYTLQMRIIPINKVAPSIPNKQQMRPIVVMSHVIKMIELFYEEKLKNYVNLEINPEQIGFIQGIGTHIHLQEIIRYLKIKGQQGKTAIFIDLSNAYNVVDRDKLYQILKKRQVFGDKALNFLFSLYDELYFWDEWKGEKVKVLNGLHQGSILSPYLFDIYFDELINEWKQKMRQKALAQKIRNKKRIEQQIRSVKILAYANDLVFLNNKYTSGISFELFNELALEYNFQINLKKTNFMSQTRNQKLIQMGCNWVESYKYLGVWLNIRGSLKPHYQIMKKIVKKNSWRVRALSKLLPARHIFKLRQIYVKPYFDYILTALWLQKQPIVKQFQALWRSCIRIMTGMHKCFLNRMLEELFGQISYFGNEDQFLMKQEEKNLNRWINQEKKNQQIYYQKNQDCLGEGYLERIQPIIQNRVEEYIQRMQIDLKRKKQEIQFQRWLYHQVNNDIPQWNSEIIRKIPNYHFFNLFKYESMICKLCKKSLTIQHINSHFGTSFELVRGNLVGYILHRRKFDKQEQKSQNNLAHNVSKQLDKLAQSICEKRIYKKKSSK